MKGVKFDISVRFDIIVSVRFDIRVNSVESYTVFMLKSNYRIYRIKRLRCLTFFFIFSQLFICKREREIETKNLKWRGDNLREVINSINTVCDRPDHVPVCVSVCIQLRVLRFWNPRLDTHRRTDTKKNTSKKIYWP